MSVYIYIYIVGPATQVSSASLDCRQASTLSMTGSPDRDGSPPPVAEFPTGSGGSTTHAVTGNPIETEQLIADLLPEMDDLLSMQSESELNAAAGSSAFQGLDEEAAFWENWGGTLSGLDVDVFVPQFLDEFHGANAIDVYREERSIYYHGDTFCEQILCVVDDRCERMFETGSLISVSDFGHERMSYPEDMLNYFLSTSDATDFL